MYRTEEKTKTKIMCRGQAVNVDYFNIIKVLKNLNQIFIIIIVIINLLLLIIISRTPNDNHNKKFGLAIRAP